MKRLPHALVVGLIIQALSSLVFLLLFLGRADHGLTPSWEMVTNGMDAASHALAAAGAFQLARSLAGRPALGAKIAAVAQVGLLAMVAVWIAVQMWTGSSSENWVWKVFGALRYVDALLWLAAAVGFALVAVPLGVAIALVIVAVLGIPVPALGHVLYGSVHSQNLAFTIELVPYILVSILMLAAAWSRRAQLVDIPPPAPADAFRRASGALWLRVISAVSLAGFTFLVGMARSPDMMGLLRAVMLLAPLLDALALLLFARAVVALARTGLAPWLLTAGAGFALAATGMMANRIVQLYVLFYGHRESSFFDATSRDPVLGGTVDQILPLIAATGIALVLVAIGRLARERNAEDLRENIVIRTGVFVALVVGSQLMIHFIGAGSMSDAGVAVFLLVAIAGATLYALTIAAKLCAQGAELVARDPAGLPAAKVVSS